MFCNTTGELKIRIKEMEEFSVVGALYILFPTEIF
jgi:hypothetical protein